MSNPVYHHIEGAPVQVGTRVVVGSSLDETFDEARSGQTGTVDHLEYAAGCGEAFPGDPMIGVRFPDGHVDGFWIEELLVLRTTRSGLRGVRVLPYRGAPVRSRFGALWPRLHGLVTRQW